MQTIANLLLHSQLPIQFNFYIEWLLSHIMFYCKQQLFNVPYWKFSLKNSITFWVSFKKEVLKNVWYKISIIFHRFSSKYKDLWYRKMLTPYSGLRRSFDCCFFKGNIENSFSIKDLFKILLLIQLYQIKNPVKCQ